MQATPKIWWRHRAAAIAAQLVKVRDVHDINWILMNARNGLGQHKRCPTTLRRFGCVVIMGVAIWLGDRFNLRTGQFRRARLNDWVGALNYLVPITGGTSMSRADISRHQIVNELGKKRRQCSLNYLLWGRNNSHFEGISISFWIIFCCPDGKPFFLLF